MPPIPGTPFTVSRGDHRWCKATPTATRTQPCMISGSAARQHHPQRQLVPAGAPSERAAFK
ncbi:hypothetical protein GCM10018952_22330 [Streptosporangium vulgare]